MHNIRIERLWVDVTSGFGQKWKEFFQLLEASYGLDVENNAHIWLLRHLFLPTINHDAEQWTAVWNMHLLGNRHLSPSQMYLHGVIQNGYRGIFPNAEQGETENPAEADYMEYGIDWEALQTRHIRAHHDEHNADDGNPHNPFLVNHPEHLSHVEVKDTNCPLSPEQLSALNVHLTMSPFYERRSMEACLGLWVAAMDLLTQM